MFPIAAILPTIADQAFFLLAAIAEGWQLQRGGWQQVGTAAVWVSTRTITPFEPRSCCTVIRVCARPLSIDPMDFLCLSLWRSGTKFIAVVWYAEHQ